MNENTIKLGEVNSLGILRERQPGLFLGYPGGVEEVLLPNRYKPETFEIGDQIDVFVYKDNEERLVAVTDMPHIKKGEFALLRCSESTPIGAFLDWGMVKELFCPFKEQVFKMNAGGWYLVYCFLDEKSGRLVASSKTNKLLDNTNLTVSKYEKVEVIISHPSDFGMNVIVNGKHKGVIYNDQIFKTLHIGDKHEGVVAKVREDNKLDIILQDIGYRNIEPNAEHILTVLKESKGFLPLTDHSDPQDIKDWLEISKKSFKKALGTLYKQRIVEIKEDGIYLLPVEED